MPTPTLPNGPAPVRTPGARRRLVAVAALGLAVAAAACSKRERVLTVDADLGHDLDLASTTGIELANRGAGGTQVVSAIEETPRTAPRRSAAQTPKSAGHRRHKVARKPEIDAPPATVMVADHEMAAAATTEAAAGTETVATAPAQTTDPGPAITPQPVSYPAGGGTDVGRGSGGIGDGGMGGGIGGVIIRGGVGGIDPCDERDGHGRHGDRGGSGGIGSSLPGGVWGGIGAVLGGRMGSRGGTSRSGVPAGGGRRWPTRGSGGGFPRR